MTRPTVRTVEAVEEDELSVYLLQEYVYRCEHAQKARTVQVCGVGLGLGFRYVYRCAHAHKVRTV